MRPRILRHPLDRAKAALGGIDAFAKARGRWPNAGQLERFRPRLGSHATVHETLTFLRERQLVELLGANHSSRWAVTPAGYDAIKRPPFHPPLELVRQRQDAASILEDATTAQVATSSKPLRTANPAHAARLAANLALAE